MAGLAVWQCGGRKIDWYLAEELKKKKKKKKNDIEDVASERLVGWDWIVYPRVCLSFNLSTDSS